MSRETSPLRLGADPFLFRHSAQLVERALPLREWFSSGLRSCFVSICEAEERFLFAVAPYPCGGAIPFLKHQASRASTREVATHCPIGDSWPMAFLGWPGRHRGDSATRARAAR